MQKMTHLSEGLGLPQCTVGKREGRKVKDAWAWVGVGQTAASWQFLEY